MFLWVNDGMTETLVCLPGHFLAARLGVICDGLGDIVVFLDDQIEELEPVADRNQFDVVLGDVAQEQELALEELFRKAG